MCWNGYQKASTKKGLEAYMMTGDRILNLAYATEFRNTATSQEDRQFTGFTESSSQYEAEKRSCRATCQVRLVAIVTQ